MARVNSKDEKFIKTIMVSKEAEVGIRRANIINLQVS
jgi:hypothetical protein